MIQVPCLHEALPKVGCDLEDQGCACRQDKRDKLVPLVTGCAMSHCNPSELMQAKAAADRACKGGYMAAALANKGMNGTRIGVAQYPNSTTLVVKPTSAKCSTTAVVKPTSVKCSTTLLVKPAKTTGK